MSVATPPRGEPHQLPWPVGYVRYFADYRSDEDVLWITMIEEGNAYAVPQYAAVGEPSFVELPLSGGFSCAQVQEASAFERAELTGRRKVAGRIIAFLDEKTGETYFVVGGWVRYPSDPPGWLADR